MILLIDNYDSFVFNLARYIERLGQTVDVVRNDRVSLQKIADGVYGGIVISPGPQAPDQAGACLQVIQQFYRTVPMFGVCLGHQAICQALGGEIVRAPRPVHGRTSAIHYRKSRLLEGLENPFCAARYHSLVAESDSLPSDLIITAVTHEPIAGTSNSTIDLVMAVEHESLPIFGVQFHPESILSEVGYKILSRFLSIAGMDPAVQLPPSDLVAAPLEGSTSNRDWMQATSGNDIPLAVLPRAGRPAS